MIENSLDWKTLLGTMMGDAESLPKLILETRTNPASSQRVAECIAKLVRRYDEVRMAYHSQLAGQGGPSSPFSDLHLPPDPLHDSGSDREVLPGSPHVAKSGKAKKAVARVPRKKQLRHRRLQGRRK